VEGLSEALRVVNLVAVCALAVASARQWRRRGEAAAGWVAIAFGGLASLFVARRLAPESLTTELLVWVEKVPLTLAVSFPYFLYRFATSFSPLPPRIGRLVDSLTAILVAWTILLPGVPYGNDGPRPAWASAYIAGAVGHWLALSALVAIRLWAAGHGQPSVARYRMRALSVASLCLSLGILMAAGPSDRPPSLDVAFRFFLLASYLLFVIGLWPPRVLRMAWRRPAEGPLRTGLDNLMTARRQQEVGKYVCVHAVEIVGGSAAELVDSEGRLLGSYVANSTAESPADLGAVVPDRLKRAPTVELDFSFGRLRVWASPYAPFFGSDEVELVRSLGALADLALERVRGSETEARLAASLKEQADLLDLSHDSILVRDMDDTITLWNKGAERNYGWSRDEAVGKSSHILLGTEFPVSLEESTAALLSKGHWEGELVHSTKDGRRVVVASRWSLRLDSEHRPDAILEINSDVTQRKEAERALGAAKAEAEAANRAKSEFLANMSHEIRTPMNGVIGMTGLLLETDLLPEQLEYAETAHRSGEALLTVINDILDFSKIEAGKMDLEVVDFDIRTAVEEVADLMAGPAHDKGLELATLVDPDLPPGARGDPGRLRQVLLNLVSNAVKFTDEGEVVARARLVHDDSDAVVVRFEVCDTGIGIAPETQGRLFASFSQADASTTRRYGGTGLGLAVSKQLVELMGGDMGVVSDVGKGSTFWFTARLEKRPAPPPTRSTTGLAGRLALVVDDNDTNRAILEHTLRFWDMIPVTAREGAEALRLLHAHAQEGRLADVAVVDFHMPGMDGIELTRTIRADPVLAGMRVVLLTSSAQEGEAAAARQAGVDAYLTKPVRQWSLQRTLTAVLGMAPATVTDDRGHARVARTTEVAKHVLVVEDNVVNQKVAARMLETLGHRVDLAANGAEGVEAVSRIPYDLVFMDVQMPEMDGYEATAAIRAMKGPARQTPIVAMTAGAMKGDEERCLAAGMDGYVTKPVTIDELGKAVERWATVPNEKPRTSERPCAG